MLDLNKHIKVILDACVQHTEYPHVINVGEKEVVVKIERNHIDVTGLSVTVDRFITIEAETDDNRFWVRVQEIARDPVFTTMRTAQQFRARHKEDLDWAQRYVYAHIKEAVKPNFIPPKALVEQMQAINDNWLPKDDHQVILYLDAHEYGDDWRYRIVNTKTGDIVCSNLEVGSLTGPLACSILRAFKDGYRKGFVEGVAHVSQSQARAIFQASFNSAGIASHDIPASLTEYMRGKSSLPTH